MLVEVRSMWGDVVEQELREKEASFFVAFIRNLIGLTFFNLRH